MKSLIFALTLISAQMALADYSYNSYGMGRSARHSNSAFSGSNQVYHTNYAQPSYGAAYGSQSVYNQSTYQAPKLPSLDMNGNIHE